MTYTLWLFDEVESRWQSCGEFADADACQAKIDELREAGIDGEFRVLPTAERPQ